MEGKFSKSKLERMGSGDRKPFENTKGKSTRKFSKHAENNSTRSPLVVLKHKCHNVQKTIQHIFCISPQQPLPDDDKDDKDDLLDREYENRHSMSPKSSSTALEEPFDFDNGPLFDRESNADEDCAEFETDTETGTFFDLYERLNYSQIKDDDNVDSVRSSSSLRFSEVAYKKEAKEKNLFRSTDEIEEGSSSINPELPATYDAIKDDECEETSKTVTKHNTLSSYDYEYLRTVIPIVISFTAYCFVLFLLTWRS